MSRPDGAAGDGDGGGTVGAGGLRVAVVGGGIAGLSAAWVLSGRGARVTVFDPGPLGGKLRTTPFAGRPVEEGPDAFLSRTPEATALCAELGVEDLVAPSAGHTLLWVRDRLRPLPEGLVLGVPGRLGPVVRSGLLSPVGLARAGMDLVLPRRRYGEDVSAGQLISDRFGRQVSTRLVEPLLGSIHAAPLDELSASIVAPQVLAAARSSRSLLLGLRRQAPPPAGGPRPPIFLTPAAGLGRLVGALVDGLQARGVVFRAAAVASLDQGRDRVELASAGGTAERFDAAVLAVPAFTAAALLGPVAPAGLADIPFTTVAVLSVAVPASQWTPPAGFNGFLVPAGEGRLMTACSFYSNKWPARAGAGRDDGDPGGAGPAGRAPLHVLRISAGRHGDSRVEELSDGALEARLIDEMGAAAGRLLRPLESRLTRWPASFPLYRVGHASRVDAMEADLAARAPRVALAGSSYRGAGIPACIRSGREAAERLLVGVGV